MYRRHNYEERLNIVSRILCGETIDSICREFQLDREMVRQWLLRYQKYGEDGLRGTRDSITKCKIFVLNSHHIFDARDLMADWGWGFTNPQPLPNPILSRAKGNFQLAIQKKGDRSLPEIN